MQLAQFQPSRFALGRDVLTHSRRGRNRESCSCELPLPLREQIAVMRSNARVRAGDEITWSSLPTGTGCIGYVILCYLWKGKCSLQTHFVVGMCQGSGGDW